MSKNGFVSWMAPLAACGCFGGTAAAGRTQEQALEEKQNGAAAERRFCCNTKALNPHVRARHGALTKRLLAMRKETVETDKGYEFRYSPADVTVAEVAEWVAAESKCCPFFDFYIDLENVGTLVRLRLTGAEGVKQFIRAELAVKCSVR
jgi:hypothetical protein